MAQVEIYTARFCGFCHSAKALLSRKGIKFLEIDVSGDPRERSKMIERANGRTTVPQIFVGSTHIGGCDDLYALYRTGGLDPLLAAEHHTRGIRMSTHLSTSATFTVGLVQLRSGLAPAANLETALRLIAEAKAAGADYVQTPEMTNIMDIRRERMLATVVPEENDASLARLRELARTLSIWLHVGSLAIKVSPDRAANRSFLIDPTGEIVARYDKIHMFDVDLAGGESYRESNSFRPGDCAVAADLPWGRLGLTICYDLRFPALYRALAEAGTSFIAIPAAFTKQTGEAHWHILIRARAIENGCYVLAAAQGGMHENGRSTFGHSLVVDPWGRILAEGDTEPGIVMAKIDPAEVAAARGRVPSLRHGRRFEIVEPLAEPVPFKAIGGER